MPLPRALGKYRARKNPAVSDPATGINSPSPGCAVGGIKLRPEVFGEENERYNHQPDHGADDQREKQQDLIFALQRDGI